jgi:cation transport ATPase
MMPTERLTLPVFNLGCAATQAAAAERLLLHTRGVATAYVNPATEMAYVAYDPARIEPSQLLAVLERAGFGPGEQIVDHALPDATAHVCRIDRARLALAAGLVLAAIWLICSLAALAAPGAFPLLHLWLAALPGIDPATRWTWPLGLLESFAAGALGGWAVAALYNRLPAMRFTARGGAP